MALYWFENIVGGLAMAIRISEHRRLTGDKEHRHPQLGFTMTTSSGRNGKEKPVKFKSFLAEFFTASMAFGAGHGAFLFAVLAATVEKPEYAALKEGAITIALCHAIAVTVDLFTIQNWPFAKLKTQAEGLMGRAILVQFALIGGTWLAIYRDSKDEFFRVFVWLKTASDIFGMLPDLSSANPPVIALDSVSGSDPETELVERDNKRKKKKR